MLDLNELVPATLLHNRVGAAEHSRGTSETGMLLELLH